MRRILFILAATLGLALAVTVFLWFDTRTAHVYIAVMMDYRTPNDPKRLSFSEGTRSYGVYANHGRIGFLIDTNVRDMEDNMNVVPYQPTCFTSEHLNDSESGIYEQLRPSSLAYSLRSKRLGLSLYDGWDAGGGSSEGVQGGLVDTWIVAAFLAAMLGFTVWCIRRPRRKLKAGLCPTCSYDIRTQLLGQAGLNCPECGTPIKPRSIP